MIVREDDPSSRGVRLPSRAGTPRSKLPRGIFGAIALGVAAMAGVEPAGASPEEESPTFSLAYSAPAACPDRDAFVSSIRARTARPRLVRADDGASVAVRVVIETRDAGAASGRLDLREADGTEETRTVTSRTCAEVSSALALVAAVMLDPEARSTAEPSPTLPPPAPSPSPPRAPSPASPSPARPPPASPSPPRPPPSTEWPFAAGAHAGIMSGIGPAIAPIGGVFATLERRTPTLASSLRLGVDIARTSSALRSGTQTYEWLGAAMRLCPAYVSLRADLRLAPCAGFQAAALRGTTRDVRSPTANLQLWLAPVAGGSVEWALSSTVSLELEGAALFPLRRARFFLAPNSTIFEVPSVAGTVTAGVRVRFL